MVKEKMNAEEAEELAIRAFGFLASNPEYLGTFLAATGLGPDNLRQAAADTGFLVGVLDFVMSDESMLLTFTESYHVRPTLVAVARYRLDRSAEP